MQMKNNVRNLKYNPAKIANQTLKHSTLICSEVLQELMSKIFKDLPPDPEILLQYSGLVIKNTTQKLVDVTMLDSQIIPCDSDYEQEQQDKLYTEPQEITSGQQLNSKKSQTKNPKSQFSNQQQKYSQKFPFRPFKINKSYKLRQDEQIHVKKEGIKLIKRQQLKNLIKHRMSNSHSSLHIGSSNVATCQKIMTKKSIYQNSPILHIKDMGIQNQNKQNKDKSKNITYKNLSNPSFNKSTKSFSTLPGVNKNHGVLGLNYQKQRISGVMNQTQFINLKEYYKQKSEKNPNNPVKKLNSFASSPFTHNKNYPSNFSTLVRQNLADEESAWLHQKQGQKFDQADIIINKLRQRKQKFYRTGANYSNGESYVNTRRQNTLIMAQNQKGSSQNNQAGAMIAFDYSGEVLPTFKYDTIKMQAHYQDMEFAITQNDESLAKKKERKGHMFRGAINLKLVDHQRFIPHPHYKYEPLVQKPGMLMKQNTAYALKRGVQLRSKQQNTGNTSCAVSDSEQPKQKINKTAFEFLYNQELDHNKVKYQDFVRFKKSAQSANSFYKSPSSRKKLQQKDESILSKKSITLKGLKGKQGNQQDASNKVYKSENRKALELLINANNLTNHEQNSTKDHIDLKNMEHSPLNGVLKKNSLHCHTKSLSNNTDKNNQQIKKKVRIA